MLAPPPYSPAQLAGGACLCIAGLRRARYARRGEIPFAFIQCLGPDAKAAFEEITRLDELIRSFARRQAAGRTDPHAPATAEELAIAGMIAAVASARMEEARMRLEWLATPPFPNDVLAKAVRFADLLACHGYDVELPALAPRPSSAAVWTAMPEVRRRSGKGANRQ